jgi:histidine triad (HIT) family protein
MGSILALVDGCVFCSIVSGSKAAAIVLDDEVAVGFLDHRPLFKGHVLVVPRFHVATLPELTPVGPLFERVALVARALVDAFEADGSFVAVNNTVSQSVPHLHVHVVPRRKGDGLRGFMWPRQRYVDADEIESYAARLRDLLNPGRTGRGIDQDR